MSNKVRKWITIDGNEAAAYVAYAVNEVISIYPITPSSPMAELSETWCAEKKPNLWGMVPTVREMQSESGVSGAYHGALQAGALCTTFTASQGLLLMIPNMYKIAGELTSTVMNVAARTVASHALSIFGDHSDVMAVRNTGWAMLSSSNVQEVMDMTLISQMSTLKSRVPFINFFDGFRTSHEEMKVEQFDYDDMRSLMDDNLVRAHRMRRLTPDDPFIRGTAQNPDTFFQCREACTPYYNAVPDIVQESMDRFAKQIGRQYHIFDYYGASDAERVIVLMGSSASVTKETIDRLVKEGQKVGLVCVHLFRPFDVKRFTDTLPKTVKAVAVLDRTKDAAGISEPLCADVREALLDRPINVIGGRYGLSSKDFTPAMAKAVFDELAKPMPKKSFTVGIDDDICYSSLEYDPEFDTEDPETVRCVFYGIGGDGTVGANKNSIKIIGEQTDLWAQGYYSYDSKKSGGLTISHLRFGPNPIYASYEISKANFVACHGFHYMETMDILASAAEGAIFLLNSPYEADKVWEHLPLTAQKHIIDKKLKFYVIDAVKIAKQTGLGQRKNTIMQTCFFAISGILPKEKALQAIKASIIKSYMPKGQAIVDKNLKSVDEALSNMQEVKVPVKATANFDIVTTVPENAPEFVKKVLAPIMSMKGEKLPVSAMPKDGTFPVGTSQYEKRNIASEVPVWNPNICIQCGKCSIVCPHAAIRAQLYDAEYLKNAPRTFKSADVKPIGSWKVFEGNKFTIQVSVEDCMGCQLCVKNCPMSKPDSESPALKFEKQIPLREQERENWKFFLSLPDVDRNKLNFSAVKDVQLLHPLFEFSGACTGCGETAYIKLLSSLFGSRALIANATGCSSIYCGNLPTTPWTKDNEGKGPAWNNSLFEDAAEFGLGFRFALDKHEEYARELLEKMSTEVGRELVRSILENEQRTEDEIRMLQNLIVELKNKLKSIGSETSQEMLTVADNIVRKSVWAIGGDGWAYDIGFGGVDHILSQDKNVNILVLDTEVYSNTGGQMSKSTPRGAIAKFAAAGKKMAKKDLALMAMTYANAYVGRIALGADEAQAIKVLREAEAYDGPSIVIAYCHCISHGIAMSEGLEQQKRAVASGHWLLMHYNPALIKEGKNPLSLDCKAPSIPLKDYIYRETRYKRLSVINPQEAEHLLQAEEKNIMYNYNYYKYLSEMPADK